MNKFLGKREIFQEVKKKSNEYKEIVDYNSLEIEIEDKNKLIECEKNIVFHQQKTAEHLMAISETLFNAQEVLASYGNNGKFRLWFESLGMKKDFVYMCLKRYGLYVQYNMNKVMELPEKVVKEITKQDSEVVYEEADIVKIIEATKPSVILKEIKEDKLSSIFNKSLSGCPTNYANENTITGSQADQTEDDATKIAALAYALEDIKKHILEMDNITEAIKFVKKELKKHL